MAGTFEQKLDALYCSLKDANSLCSAYEDEISYLESYLVGVNREYDSAYDDLKSNRRRYTQLKSEVSAILKEISKLTEENHNA